MLQRPCCSELERCASTSSAVKCGASINNQRWAAASTDLVFRGSRLDDLGRPAASPHLDSCAGKPDDGWTAAGQ